MSTEKHTPGPWRYVPNLNRPHCEACGVDDWYAFPYLIYAGAEFIGQVATDQLCDQSADETNARLIAAAPDLLAELEFLADKWAYEIDNDEPINGADFVQWFAECLPRIRAAIAKATGGA